MNHHRNRWIKSLACLATLACCAAAFRSPSPADDAAAEGGTVLAEAGPLRWYRGNLHTHTLWSDGDEYLEQVARWYKEHDYDFLCVTDHNTVAQSEKWIDVEKSKGGLKAYEKLKAQFPEDWIVERKKAETQKPERQETEPPKAERLEVRLKTYHDVAERLNEPGEFLLLPGEEISDRFGKLPIHLIATNVKETIPPLGGESIYEVMQRNVDAVLAQRERTGQPMLVHLNHPNFYYAITAEDLMRVRGENFFEVYNGHPTVYNAGDEQHASTDRMWDIINSFRLTELELPMMYGLGTDDAHNYHNIPSRAAEPGRAWVMVLAETLTPDALISAMESGRFYATNGVLLERIAFDKDRLSVEVQPEEGVQYRIEFLGTRRGFDRDSEPVTDKDGQPVHTTRRYSEDIGAVLKAVDGAKGEYEFTGDELYVRARVTSSKPHPNPSTVGDKEQAWLQPVHGPGFSP